MAAGGREWFDSAGRGDITPVADRVRTRLCLPQSDWISVSVLRSNTRFFGDGTWPDNRRMAHRAAGCAALCSDRAGLPVERDRLDLATQPADTTPVALDFTLGRDSAVGQLDLSAGRWAEVRDAPTKGIFQGLPAFGGARGDQGLENKPTNVSKPDLGNSRENQSDEQTPRYFLPSLASTSFSACSQYCCPSPLKPFFSAR